MQAERVALTNERDDLKLRVRRAQEAIDGLQQASEGSADGKAAVETMVRELTRKVIAFEVNEAVLSRKYTAAVETSEREREKRRQLEEGMFIIGCYACDVELICMCLPMRLVLTFF